LALQLGMTVSELMQRMSALEETHWMALYQFEPWGDHRADIRSGQIAQILYNSNVKKGRSKTLTDFLPFYRKKVKEDENIVQSVRNVFANVIKHQGKP